MTKISVVSATYNVAPYLDDFFSSIIGQNLPSDNIEIIMVNDGSTDDSVDIIESWMTRYPEHIRMVHKANGGQSSARNMGIRHASGEWLTFIDPDDMVGFGYFDSVTTLMERHPDVPMFSANRVYYEEDLGVIRDGHPLRYMMLIGDDIVDLRANPEYFFHHVGASFFRRDDVLAMGLEFDLDVRPVFEDAHFCIRYLLGTEERIGFVASAEYLYRRRSDQSSTMQKSNLSPEKFTNVPRYGYLGTLKLAAAKYGLVPEWLQNMIIYDLTWFFSAEESPLTLNTAARGAVAQEFVSLLREIREYLDDDVVESFWMRGTPRRRRTAIAEGLKSPHNWVNWYVFYDRFTADRDLRLRLTYVGERPAVKYFLDGEEFLPEHRKVQEHRYFEATLLKEEIAWVPATGTLRVRVNGRFIRLVKTTPPAYPTGLYFGRPKLVAPAPVKPLESALRPGSALVDSEDNKMPTESMESMAAAPIFLQETKVRLKRLRKLAKRSHILRRAYAQYKRRFADHAQPSISEASRDPRRYRNAWVIMDRIQNAGDNGERLFEYLRSQRQDINAWFVLHEDSYDWKRLKNSASGDRVVAHGSKQWVSLMRGCSHLISSHIDVEVVAPPAILKHRRANWKFIFLQHGVIYRDLSAWLNTKRIDLMCSTTPSETAAIAGDGPYELTSKEVQYTGLARHDRLLELAAACAASDRKIILVAPTWRRGLSDPAALLESSYMQSWLQVLQSAELAATAKELGLDICFMPHPEVQRVLDLLTLPDHVRVAKLGETDIQTMFARTRLMITDYSSMAFDVAFLGRPVVYYQFDAEEVAAGGHLGREGYFDVLKDGFGPVARAAGDVVSHTRSLLLGEDPKLCEYRNRMAETFPLKDGRACERITKSILGLSPEESGPGAVPCDAVRHPTPVASSDQMGISLASKDGGTGSISSRKR